tara:strand:+ start:580 stop:852 length:273 start_codon:yes stop_codon:yes gene_type:complete
MKIYIEGKGLQDLPKEEADKIKERQSDTAPWRLEVLRTERNRLLAETDFYANTDVTMTDKMKAYRQELRDITKKFQSMKQEDFEFPTKPE